MGGRRGAPSERRTCSDDTSVVVAGNGDQIYQRLVGLIGRADLAEDAALRTNSGRWVQRDRLDAAIAGPGKVALPILECR